MGEEYTPSPVSNSHSLTPAVALALVGSDLVGSASFFPHPTNATTAIIKRTCFMPATLCLTGSGVNAVGGIRGGRGERVTWWGFLISACLLRQRV
jgi:hypothetical protein